MRTGILTLLAVFLFASVSFGMPDKKEIKRHFDQKNGQYLAVDDARIYYEEIGNQEKPILLILHGGFQSIKDMNPMTDYLADDFRIIGIDTRGHGKSTLGDKELTYERVQKDVEAIAAHLKLDRVHILGFSDGGVVAYRIASDKRLKVEKLVTIGASWSIKDVLATEEIYKEITPESAKEWFRESYEDYQRLNPKPDFDDFTRKLIAMWTDKTEAGHPDERVKNITADALIIRGDNDFLVSLDSIAKLKNILAHASVLNVPFCGHTVYEEKNGSNICSLAMRQFLTEEPKDLK